MLTILGALVPLAVRVISSFLDKKTVDYETRKQWLGFVLAMQKNGAISARLRDDYQSQLDDLNKP